MSKGILQQLMRVIGISPCVDFAEEATVRVFSYHVVTYCFAGTVDNISDAVTSVNR